MGSWQSPKCACGSQGHPQASVLPATTPSPCGATCSLLWFCLSGSLSLSGSPSLLGSPSLSGSLCLLGSLCLSGSLSLGVPLPLRIHLPLGSLSL